ncbi:hypothetical protein [Spirosoma endbachense]|uniref:Uncharacterized protein n=1 Tax=Spirosoma endbachense TaxID=2666025 RepID=A0A6P1W2G7_9BACT|nr:hypothetical protein [Spirosoma endbachense]QHV99245.1 hypothetical protein GJR95_31400 [Spirosoma endbachense]
MNQGFINRIKAQIRKIEAYLKEHQGELTEEEINEALDRINFLKDCLEGFD